MKANETAQPSRAGTLPILSRRPAGSRVAAKTPSDPLDARARRADGSGAPIVPATVMLRRAACAGTVRGEHVGVLIDELGARLAGERVAVRLYDSLLRRMDRMGPIPAAIGRAAVERLRHEEVAHVTLLSECITELGGDPESVTAADDVYARAGLALPQRIGDPRADFAICLERVLRAEIAAEDGWTVLVALARLLDRDGLARRFERALAAEKEQLRTLRGWARGSTRETDGAVGE